jgi:outer membrane protein assembly factor BamB
MANRVQAVWFRVTRWIGLLAAGALVAGGLLWMGHRTALAQQPRGEAGDPQEGVYVRDSAIAADKFELGKRMERLKEWHKAADVYQEILEKYQDRVVPTLMNDKAQPIRYASVTVAVQERLSRWPNEGLAVYRARYEAAAANLLEQSRRDDLAALNGVVSRYFVTDTARDAGRQLLELYLESGEFSAAGWLGDRLLQFHPNLGPDQGAILLRTMLAHHLDGNADAAGKYFEQIRTQHADEKMTLAGQTVNLAKFAAEAISQKPPTARGDASDSWVTVGGDMTRSLVSSASGQPGARVYKAAVPGPTFIGNNELVRKQMAELWEATRTSPTGVAINVMPVADRGQLFFQNGYRVFAISLESGVALPGWQRTHSGQRAGQYWLSTSPQQTTYSVDQYASQQANLARQFALSLTDDVVLAVMGMPDLRALATGNVTADGGTRLVCLERETGRQRWIVNPRELPNELANIRNLSFSGSPLAVGDSVYVLARGSTGAGVEDCHLLCYEMSTGKFRWTSYIASSQGGLVNMGGLAAILNSGGISHPAFSSGRVYVVTNLGAVAAVDAYSGVTSWLSLYDRDDSIRLTRDRMMNMWGGWNQGGLLQNQNQPKSWEFNAAIVREGRIFTLPADAQELLVFNAASGEIETRIPRNIEIGENSHKVSMLLGVVGDRLLVASEDRLFCLNWKKYGKANPRSQKLDTDSTFWVNEVDEIRGRPFITRDAVYVTILNSLAIINMQSGKVAMRFPKDNARWAADEGPGNVLVAQEHVVIANARNVSVYTDIDAVRRKYAALMQAEPENVEARLTFSELMFNAREFTDAQRGLDEAIQLLGGLRAMKEGPLRDRLFTDANAFAQLLGQEKNANSIDLAEALFDRAAAAAQSPEQQVQYRFARSRFIEGLASVKQPDFVKAVGLYQDILANPQWRRLPFGASDQGGPQSAGRAAEIAIDALIKKIGEPVYAEQEKLAAALLQSLAEAKDRKFIRIHRPPGRP